LFVILLWMRSSVQALLGSKFCQQRRRQQRTLLVASLMQQNSSGNQRDEKPRKFHHLTICMVPPETAVYVWDQVTKLRTELCDPGLFRWPPHANLLYPFANVRDKDGHVDRDIIERLETACRQCEPFRVSLDRMGTFGGAKRGVLWLYPTSKRNDKQKEEEEEEPLLKLQSALEEQFPICTDQRKVGGVYNPHITVSHFVDLAAALKAQSESEEWWPRDLEFDVQEIYLLERKGDKGQFERLASIELGSTGSGTVHESPLRFAPMPEIEVDWVREERMKLKARRNGSYRRRGRQRRKGRSPRQRDSPEVIEAKRAARKAKREALEKATEASSNE